MSKYIRPDLAGLKPYESFGIEVEARLNTNENPYDLSPEIAAALGSAVAGAAITANRYPDDDFLELRSNIAAYIERESGVQFDVSQILAANGSNEIMQEVLLAFGGPGRSALTFTPTYSMYPQYCRDSFTQFISVERTAAPEFAIDVAEALAAIEQHQPSVVLIANPNNPTGNLTPAADVRALLEGAARVSPSSVVVLDEAYIEFRAAGEPSSASLIAEHPNLIVARTLSKAFSLAGVRLGYALASAELIDDLKVVRLPYNLSSITQAVANEAFKFTDQMLSKVSDIRALRDETVDWLRSLSFQGAPLEVADSDSNFIQFGRFPDRAALFDALMEHSVMLRVVGPEGFVRVTVGTPAEMARFRKALLDGLRRLSV